MQDWIFQTIQAFTFVGPVILLYGLVSFFFYRQMIFAFTGAKPVTRKDHPEIYNIVENLCISKWIPTPNIGIMEDDSLNAFATGRWPKNARIVFSRGLLAKLSKQEIEAVAGHELTHIINRDTLLMIVVIVFVWAVATLWEIILRIGLRSRGGKKDNIGGYLILVGGVLAVLWYLVFPLIQLAISRRREYLADAWSVEITKDSHSLISALEKISHDPIIESIEKQTVAAMCIETPFQKHESGIKHRFQNLLSTHPTIPNRIKALRNF